WLPKLEGMIGMFRYYAMDVKIVLEITPKLDRPLPPAPALRCERRRRRSRSTEGAHGCARRFGA
ncbi:MAG: hypothetical protein JWN04_728, partial [Myxococcaceae bacterium]|nr:hypothetical protein [Myxococcaceae bacterium]